VWYQATRHAASVGSDLVIVTADEKEDWWWRQRAVFVAPRPELTLESHQRRGRRLFLLHPSDLLARAAAPQVQVDANSVADPDRPREIDQPATPWTAEAVTLLIERVERQAPARAAPLRLAIESDTGSVSREKVYELGGYSDDRMLRDFTRPFRRLTESLQEAGRLPQGLSPIFEARYPDGVKASYVVVPPEVVGLELTRRGRAEAIGQETPSEV
jgi:hypothetical protein